MSNFTFFPPSEPDFSTIHHHTTTQNSYASPNYLVDNYFNYHLGFELSHYLDLPYEEPLINNIHEDSNSNFTPCNISQTPLTQEMTSTGSSASSVDMQEECQKVMKRAKGDKENVVAFRTKTELESLDDGFKWRKYGKKMVKSNPNPRNYYKCSTEGCKVKKRVERDAEDSSYLITSYEGRHNHESPCVIYCDQLPLALSYTSWTLQPSY
ncbi:hypothetical protein ACH5RR_026717 [Cinchona calisaya]|uniref:WRKY domain-containing protein n=1 Tax=Cinchona calisaya TaxID=153742 RepID=A0ABD2Z6N7_9GENT